MKKLTIRVKKVISVVLIAVSTIVLVRWNQNYYNDYKLITESCSPDGKYTLSIHLAPADKNTIVPLASGIGMHSEAIVILKDNKGKILVKPTRLCHCKFTYIDLQIDWLLDEKKVYFTKFDYIDLNKMKLVC